MFQLIAHVKPNKKSEFFGKVLGAYVTIFINYPEIVGAYLLARHYIENGNWKILELKSNIMLLIRLKKWQKTISNIMMK